MKERLHQEIEIIAGAIALGEATDEDRRRYREHIASCHDCLNELGGEHEIARTAASVGAARDSEVWAPEVRSVLEHSASRPSQGARFGFGLVATCLAVLAAGHLLDVSQAARPAAAPVPVSAARIVPAPPQTPRRLVVFHNVVQMARAPVALPDPSHSGNPHPPAAKPAEMAAVTVYPAVAQDAKKAKVPARRRDSDWRTISRMTTTALTETAPQRVTNAELLQLGSVRRSAISQEAAPIGGETAINPQPPMIAYAEGAQGTTAFEVLIDERGVPTKCVITKPAGYRFLDDAVCKAAMSAHYTPKTLGGIRVPGVYRDAFTFRMTDDTSQVLPKPIH